MKKIIEGLDEYLNKENAPWHMPGHKRRADICPSYNVKDRLLVASGMDVTEVYGTDDLHHPEDMIKESIEELTSIYGTYKSYYMVNGSTGGILASITACSKYFNTRRSILIARNSHKSVYNIVELLGLNPIYIDNINVSTNGDFVIAKAIDKTWIENIECDWEDICCMVITSPTYEGVMSDVKALSDFLHSKNIPLVVDEAHGAHLPFIDALPESAIKNGADIVVQSVHKTLGALTQTAVIHINNDIFDNLVKKYLSVYMSSSPSYVLLASIENAIIDASTMDFEKYIKDLKLFREKMCQLKNICIYSKEAAFLDNAFDYDISRIVLSSGKLSGVELEELLRDNYNIVVEMSTDSYVVLISSYADEEKDFTYLYNSLKNLDDRLNKNEINISDKKGYRETDNELVIWLKSRIGEPSEDNIYVYPPGNYIIAKDEIITEKAIDIIENNLLTGKRIRRI